MENQVKVEETTETTQETTENLEVQTDVKAGLAKPIACGDSAACACA